MLVSAEEKEALATDSTQAARLLLAEDNDE